MPISVSLIRRAAQPMQAHTIGFDLKPRYPAPECRTQREATMATTTLVASFIGLFAVLGAIWFYRITR